MRKMRKLLSLFLAVLMTMSLAIPAMAADFTDVGGDHQYYTAIQSLVARGIINGYEEEGGFSFKPDATITRAEFSKMVVYAIGMGNAASANAVSVFPDVAADHWASGVIKIAYDQKIINGFDDGTFKPEEPVTYEQAIKMVVIAKSAFIGQQAEKAGGYPNGYVNIARNYGFLKKITDGVAGQPAKRGTIAQLMDNMLKIDLADKFGSEGGNLFPSLNGNQLEEVDGQVVAINGATIEDKETKLRTYEIKVVLDDGETQIFDASEIDERDNLYSFLGKQVTIFYEDDYNADVFEISEMNIAKNRNYEFTLGVEEISDYSNTYVKYYDERDNEQKLSISSKAVILYNGSYYDATDFEDLLTDNIDKAGSIRFLSTEGEDTPADIIFFTSYSNWFVTSVSKASMTVYGEVNGSTDRIVLDTEDDSKNITITKDGKSVDFAAIAKNQVLSISESTDGKFIEVLISSDAPSGKITAMTRDEKKITVASKQYTFAADVEFGDDIMVGATLKLYLDAFGKIAKYTFQTASDNYIYGYLMQFENFGSDMESDVRMRLLNLNSTSTKEPVDLKLASRVNINGKIYNGDDYEEMLALLQETAQYYEGSGDYDFDSDEVFQPIKYTVSAGVVNSMLIGKQGINENDADIRINTDFLEDGITCTTKNTTLGSIYKLTSTKVVFVPEADRLNSKEYTIRTGSNSGFAKGTKYNVLLIDVSKANVPAVVVVYGESGSASTEWVNIHPAVVTSTRIEGDSEELVYVISAQTADGNVVDYKSESDSYFEQVEKGDIIRVFADSEKKIEEMEIVIKAKDAFNGSKFISAGQADGRKVTKLGANVDGTYAVIREGNNSDSDDAQMSLMAGVAFRMVENTMIMALDYPVDDSWTEADLGAQGDDKLTVMNVGSAKVIKVNFKANGVRIEDGDIGQIEDYENKYEDATKLFVYRSSSNAKLIVMFCAE